MATTLATKPSLDHVAALLAGIAVGYAGAKLLPHLLGRKNVEQSAHSDDATQVEDDSDDDSSVVPEDVELKMVLCVRQDLSMSKGKTAAQVGHAAVACWQISKKNPMWNEWAKAWNYRAAAKITLKVENEDKLDEVAAAAKAAGLPYCVIEDAGRTEIPAGSRTVLGIGPAPKDLIDKITGPHGSQALKLLM